MALPAYYNATPGANTNLNGINVSEGMLRSDVNNAFRQLMADIYNNYSGVSVSYPISIANGGTAATTAAAARTSLAVLGTAGGAMTGNITRSGNGTHAYFASTSMTGGRIYVQASGTDPTSQAGDIVFEY